MRLEYLVALLHELVGARLILAVFRSRKGVEPSCGEEDVVGLEGRNGEGEVGEDSPAGNHQYGRVTISY